MNIFYCFSLMGIFVFKCVLSEDLKIKNSDKIYLIFTENSNSNLYLYEHFMLHKIF